MPETPPYLWHLNSSEHLVTTYEAVRAGFVALALERNRRATPYVEEARALKTLASQASSPTELLKIDAIESAVLTAAGVSDKAAGHMLPEHKLEAMQGLIKNFLEPSRYIALGELKGGIDPAGADEHWKTAGSALLRINRAFQEEGLFPHTFFVGAAIEKRMADEIWEQLERGSLSNAANLTDASQVSSLGTWLCSI